MSEDNSKKYYDEKLKAWVTVCPPGEARGGEWKRWKQSSHIPVITETHIGPPAINYGKPAEHTVGDAFEAQYRQPKPLKYKKRSKKRFW